MRRKTKSSMRKLCKACVVIVIFCVLCASIFGCASKQGEKQPSQQGEISFTDALGNEVTLQQPQRVICTMGSFAQTWYLAGGKVLATTSDAIEDRKLDLGGEVENIGTVKQPNLEKIMALNPDFVILSADIATHVSAAETLKKAGIPCALFKVEYFQDYLDMLNILTDITGRKDLYKKNGLAIDAQIKETIAKVDPTKRPTVLFLRAYSTGAKSKGEDNMVGVMLKDLGADNIASRHPSLLETITMEEMMKADPDYIFVATMGASDEEALAALKDMLFSNKAMQELKAVKNNHYYVLDKELFHYKPNHRWAESYAYLYKLLYETK